MIAGHGRERQPQGGDRPHGGLPSGMHVYLLVSLLVVVVVASYYHYYYD